MASEWIETVIIGGGQAGLTMSHHLTQGGQPHVVLERHRIAERWRTERWDSLRFQFPKWSMRLPDFAYASDDPDGFAPRDDVVRFIEAYAGFIRAPLRVDVDVVALRGTSDRFQLDTGDATIEARNVVIATGPYQLPAIPPAAAGIGEIYQISASHYRNPTQLPSGGVLVVGAGASGCQIAEELMHSGRKVYLSVGPHRRAPRRYRGRDIIWWFDALGLDEKVVDDATVRQAPLLLSGANGGHTVDLRRFAAAGMVLLGRLQDVRNDVVSFASDLAENLANGDESYAAFIRTADAHAAGLGLPTEPVEFARSAAAIDSILTLDLRAANVKTVIWATGYRYDFDWIDLDVFARAPGPKGRVPIHRRGVTAIPGVYFLGLHYLHKAKSSFLSGVGDDAAYLAEQIAARSQRNV